MKFGCWSWVGCSFRCFDPLVVFTFGMYLLDSKLLPCSLFTNSSIIYKWDAFTQLILKPFVLVLFPASFMFNPLFYDHHLDALFLYFFVTCWRLTFSSHLLFTDSCIYADKSLNVASPGMWTTPCLPLVGVRTRTIACIVYSGQICRLEH